VALDTYRKKRKFDITREPRGGRVKRGGDAFVIQKHAATRLHYDLRLELDGVMKSWAVTRGPSLVPGDKRLAVHVEDHPKEYNSFEGTIPKGQYGGGTVLIWDEGRWIPDYDPHKGYAKGHLQFELKGKKLKGHWHLVRMRKRTGEKQEPWLLIKSEDEAARTADEPDILEEKPRSAVSRRTMEAIAKAGDAVWESKKSVAENVRQLKEGKKAKQNSAHPRESGDPGATARKAKKKKKPDSRLRGNERSKGGKRKRKHASALPDFIPPQLASLHDKPPDSDNYVHEVKFDGYRVQARLADGKVKLLTRKGLNWANKFQLVADAVAELGAESALIDGEIVVEENGISDFSALQEAIKTGGSDRFVYYVFDLMHLDGADLTEQPLFERKSALKDLLGRRDRNGIIRFSEHFEETGSQMLEHARQLHLEGIISKRREAPYRSGRGDAWVKSKVGAEQEFVIVGYKDAAHLKGAIGSLILGYNEKGKLRYAGRCGTGYTAQTASDLYKTLQPLRRDTPTFGKVPEEERGRKPHWVEPKLIAEVTFAGFTAQGHVRHAAFKGLREDKPAREIVRETPMPAKKAPTKSAKKATPKKRPSAKAKLANNENAVTLTHADRVYWPDVEVTKQQLADYYTAVWDHMAPHLVDRPLALLRCPGGITEQCFFQKHAGAGLVSDHVHRMTDAHGEELLSVSDLDGLLTLVQAGVLEIHVWGSTIDDVEHCNRIVFDLDPGDDVAWGAVNKSARDLRERLKALKLESFVKTTGGKGLHVVVPTNGTPWNDAKDFAHAMVLTMEADSPDAYVSKMTKSIRKGKIFIDYLRNGRGATAVAAYSTRARAGATISAPILWDELGAKTPPDKFTVLNIGRRLGALKKDPWADIARVKQALPKLR
jgi:bifunctional non-homologous end joining protein LigD